MASFPRKPPGVARLRATQETNIHFCIPSKSSGIVISPMLFGHVAPRGAPTRFARRPQSYSHRVGERRDYSLQTPLIRVTSKDRRRLAV